MIERFEETISIAVRRRAIGAALVGVVAILVVLLAAPAVGADPGSVRPLLSGETEPNQAMTDIAVRDNRFDPTTVTVTVGSIVRWTNRGQNLHSTTSDAGHWDWTLVPGASFSARFLSAGVYGYYCRYHRAMGMTGTVVVLPNLSTPSGTVSPSVTPGGPTVTPWPSVTPGGPSVTPWSSVTPWPSVTPGGPSVTPWPYVTPGPSSTPGPTALPADDDIVFDYFTGETSTSRTDLYIVAADGTGKRQLTNTANMSEAQPNWSPDRRRVAYTVTQGDPTVGPWQLAVIDLSTGQSRAITAGREHYEPDWRPDGNLIAFTSLTRSGPAVVSSELAVIAPDGSGYRALLRLNSTYYFVGNPAWSPDGLHIAFTLESGTAGGELYVMTVATGNVTRLFEHPGWDDIDPSWSPNGRYIAFASGVARGSVTSTYHTIWVLDRTTGVAGAIVTVPEWDLRGPAWSPDALEIVFSARYQVNPSRWALYVVPATGGAVRGALSMGVEPDWGSGTLLPLPTPVPGATITPITPPAPPTFPPPPTDLPLPVTPGPSPTPPLPPTFPAPTELPVEPTPTGTAMPESTPSATATVVEATPSPAPTMIINRHSVYLPLVVDKFGTP